MTGASVYIVEDEALIGMELADRLATLGYRVLGTAPDAEEALQALARRRPELVLADINLGPGLSGIDLADRLRRLYADLPVVFLSAWSDRAILDAATAVEPAGYLIKPFDERELHATLQVALYRAQAERERRVAAAEREELELRLADARHEASLYRMAAGVAQSFGNSLGTLVAQLGLARLDAGDPARLSDSLAEAEATIAAAGRHVDLLRRYAGGWRPQRRRVDLGELCRQAATDSRVADADDASLVLVTESLGPFALGDAELLRTAVIELLRNASEALPDGRGEVELWAHVLAPDALEAWRWHPADWEPAGRRFAAITVFDTGEGIADIDQERIFEPFYSTRGLGRGLGLAVVVAAVRAAGGAVAVQSSPGQGAAVRMTLPIEDGGEA